MQRQWWRDSDLLQLCLPCKIFPSVWPLTFWRRRQWRQITAQPPSNVCGRVDVIHRLVICNWFHCRCWTWEVNVSTKNRCLSVCLRLMWRSGSLLDLDILMKQWKQKFCAINVYILTGNIVIEIKHEIKK